MIQQCPICSHFEYDALFPDYSGRCVTSQNVFLEGVTLDNRCCRGCGFIYNAQGIRGGEDRFYTVESFKPKPTVMNYEGSVKTYWERALDSFTRMTELPQEGSLLDFGAGTGAFLSFFAERYPGWALSAVEPGGGYTELTRRVELKEAFNQPYYTLEIDTCYDCIVALAVLEHVSNPLHALQWMRRRLKPGGVVLMQHPDFAKLPGDLFCADHINKLTVPHTRMLCEAAGFSVVAEESGGVPFVFSLRAADSCAAIRSVYDVNARIGREAEAVVAKTVAFARQAVESAKRKGSKAAMFGIPPISLAMPFFLDAKEHVACFVDENPNMHGQILDGLPVVFPEEMESLGVTDIALTISPVYWEQVAAKLGQYPVTVHCSA